jgi:hypothetical protein
MSSWRRVDILKPGKLSQKERLVNRRKAMRPKDQTSIFSSIARLGRAAGRGRRWGTRSSSRRSRVEHLHHSGSRVLLRQAQARFRGTQSLPGDHRPRSRGGGGARGSDVVAGVEINQLPSSSLGGAANEIDHILGLQVEMDDPHLVEKADSCQGPAVSAPLALPFPGNEEERCDRQRHPGNQCSPGRGVPRKAAASSSRGSDSPRQDDHAGEWFQGFLFPFSTSATPLQTATFKTQGVSSGATVNRIRMKKQRSALHKPLFSDPIKINLGWRPDNTE